MALQAFFKAIPGPDLIIEDGSHVPRHQADCLRFGFSALNPGGIYLLEDIHTSYGPILRRRQSLIGRILNKWRFFPPRLVHGTTIGDES
jgi:hypothetical protein